MQTQYIQFTGYCNNEIPPIVRMPTEDADGVLYFG